MSVTIQTTGAFNPAAPGAIGGTTPAAGAFTTLSASGLITATGGQIAFPATQVDSANANTLDDYEEGTWTPTWTFATPGNLSMTFNVRTGAYTKIGQQVTAVFDMTTATWSHSTASGGALVTGLPFTVSGSGYASPMEFSGFSKATYAGVTGRLSGTQAQLIAYGLGAGVAAGVVPADIASGGTPYLRSTFSYFV